MVPAVAAVTRSDDNNSSIQAQAPAKNQKPSSSSSSSSSWCDTVAKARSDLDPALHIQVPCEDMSPAKSAIVVYITAGVEEGKGTKTVFTAVDYVNGVLALGASLKDHLTTKNTHMILLLRQGFTLPKEYLDQITAVGWIIGKAPPVDIPKQYLPSFARYKSVYTKISVTGLSEYDCVLLMDADTLVVGNIDELMSCDVFHDGQEPEFRAAGVLDLYRGKWHHFNTGSTLWNTDSAEMNRVYKLTSDPEFMRKFESDQIFTNTVYPYRINGKINERLIRGEKVDRSDLGLIAHLPFGYNAQTHLEFQRPEFWDEQHDEIKIIHYTQKKGWQCPETYSAPDPVPMSARKCNHQTDANCACREGYRWYQYLKKAKTY
eukprot:CAMPEP_0116015174 /NCGR_PEP_ID=MMETSP0321-20121206/6685_1 /TAXON_ID=163516 /ORGANISM="Leptocylindrus danicus var. danicus, Strain B650" /LENGTH=374 /DNA_ID=CAMNT_0003484905 /DNA_START=111 /DNA_END=1235 /DNA_ORIENTATION=-